MLTSGRKILYFAILGTILFGGIKYINPNLLGVDVLDGGGSAVEEPNVAQQGAPSPAQESAPKPETVNATPPSTQEVKDVQAKDSKQEDDKKEVKSAETKDIQAKDSKQEDDKKEVKSAETKDIQAKDSKQEDDKKEVKSAETKDVQAKDSKQEDDKKDAKSTETKDVQAKDSKQEDDKNVQAKDSKQEDDKKDAKSTETKDVQAKDSVIPDGEAIQAALDQFIPSKSSAEFGQIPGQLAYSDLPDNPNIVDVLNANYLLDTTVKLEKIGDGLFLVKDENNPLTTKNKSSIARDNFGITGIERRTFDESVDVIVLHFSDNLKTNPFDKNKFAIIKTDNSEIVPNVALINGKDLILTLDSSNKFNYSIMKIPDLLSLNGETLTGGFLPILRTTESAAYDKYTSNLYGSYNAKIANNTIEIDKSISFGAMDDIRNSSTIAVSFNNESNVPDSCNVLVYGSDLLDANKSSAGLINLKNYTVISKRSKMGVISDLLFTELYKRLEKDMKIISYIPIKYLDVVKGLPTMYINITKPKSVDSRELYRGKLLFDLVCL